MGIKFQCECIHEALVDAVNPHHTVRRKERGEKMLSCDSIPAGQTLMTSRRVEWARIDGVNDKT